MYCTSTGCLVVLAKTKIWKSPSKIKWFNNRKWPSCSTISQCEDWIMCAGYRKCIEMASFPLLLQILCAQVSPTSLMYCVLYCILGWVNLYPKFEIEKYTACGKLILPPKNGKAFLKIFLGTTGSQICMDLWIMYMQASCIQHMQSKIW